MRSCESNSYTLYRMAYFFEQRGRYDIDQLRSADIDAFVAQCEEKGSSASFINQQLSAFRVVNKVALKRLPPLATIMIPTPHKKGKNIEKWWLRPENHTEVVKALRSPIDGRLPTDLIMADLIDIIVYTGLRVEEALRLSDRHFTGLTTDRPWVTPPGTKTVTSQNAIPVYPEAVPVASAAIERQRANGWDRLFPITLRQAGDRWNIVREFLGASDIPTATLKSLRRTFAWYANSRGMPTATLQKVLRHQEIKTTSGYLHLVGSGDLERSRDYFHQDPPQERTARSNVGEIIKAYASTPGVTPEEVARFAKELMV